MTWRRGGGHLLVRRLLQSVVADPVLIPAEVDGHDMHTLLERLTAFGIELGQRYGLGFDFGVKYLPTTDLSVQALHIPGAAAVQAVRRAVRHVTGIAGQPERRQVSREAWSARSGNDGK